MTDAPALSLAADFDPPDESRWQALAQAALKGAPFERLTTRTPDGVTIQPLYRAPDAPDAPASPLVQAARSDRPAYLPWDIRQVCAHPDPLQANAAILEDLRGGVTSIALRIDDGDGAGLRFHGADTLRAALNGVHLDIAPIAIDAGFAWRSAAPALAAIVPPGAAPTFAVDPFGAWMRWGGAPQSIEGELKDAAAFAIEAGARFPGCAALLAQGRTVHEAGAGPALELGVLLAAGAAHLRALDAAGCAPSTGAGLLMGRLSVGPDVVVEIAKLRAARVLWANLLAACGVPAEGRALRLQAVTSRRMLTRDDAWTNILRATAACFAAATGGADIVTVLPFTDPLGLPGPLARRMARNTHLILMEESRVGHVADPGGGAWAVEALTRDLAEQGWAAFQAIEAAGGLAAALRNAHVHREVAATREARAKAIATRRLPLTGVSDYPLLNETTPDAEQAPPHPAPAPQPADAIEPLTFIRLSEPFERLRDRAKPHAPKVFFANLGPLAEFSARANFAANLFAAGGVAVHGAETVYADHAAMAQAFQASGLAVAVLTGSDTRYAAESLEAATALKAAGCAWLIHAGKPADEQAVRAKGFDQFIFAGQDALAALDLLHTALGITT